MASELLYLPPWTQDYTSRVMPNVMQPEQRGNIWQFGSVRQRRYSQFNKQEISVTRKLKGNELPYFEWFIYNYCNRGADSFYDKIIDETGVIATALIRIIDGKYRVATNGKGHTISCNIEVIGDEF
jgi:hypothetical protein